MEWLLRWELWLGIVLLVGVVSYLVMKMRGTPSQHDDGTEISIIKVDQPLLFNVRVGGNFVGRIIRYTKDGALEADYDLKEVLGHSFAWNGNEEDCFKEVRKMLMGKVMWCHMTRTRVVPRQQCSCTPQTGCKHLSERSG